MKKLRIAFWGTPEFSVPTLKKLSQNNNVEIVQVISMPDRPAGRGQSVKSPPVIQFAKENNLDFSQTTNINKDLELLDKLEALDIDCYVVLAFAQFLGSRALKIPKTAAFNIHTSLLPKYRGAAPIQYALLNGDMETGVSIQRMVKAMDAGDIVKSQTVQISPDDTGGDLWNKLQEQAALSCEEFVNELLAEKITYTPQDETNISFAPTIKKEDGHLHFAKQTFEETHNRIRAFDPWPGTYCFIDNKRLKIFKIIKTEKKLSPGESLREEEHFYIGTKDQSIELLDVQFEGKKRSSMKDFLNGYRGNLTLGKI